MSTNLVVISGRLGQDVQLRYTGTGKAVANFSLAVQNGFGETKSTHWIPVVAWGELAEKTAKELKKATLTTVTGRLQNRKFKDKNEVERTVTEVVATSVGFPEVFESKSQEKRVSAQTTDPEIYQPQDEDIPF